VGLFLYSQKLHNDECASEKKELLLAISKTQDPDELLVVKRNQQQRAAFMEELTNINRFTVHKGKFI
jgi:hypothetical protein